MALHGADRRLRAGGPAARCTCAAGGGPAGGARRRADDRSAQDHFQDGIPQRAVLREPLPVEQLVVVLVPEAVLVARGPDFAGTEWRQYVGTGGTYWCMRRTTYPPAQGGK